MENARDSPEGENHVATASATATALSATSPCTEAAKACTHYVSSPGGGEARFWAATPNGSQALFSEGGTLYRYDAEAGEATQVAPGVLGVLGQSEDLSRAYFLSAEEIEGQGEEGQPNLYLDEEGAVSFIATLSAADAEATAGTPSPVNPRPNLHTARADKDGGVLAFSSDSPELAEAVSGYDNTDQESGQPATEIYRYEASGESALSAGDLIVGTIVNTHSAARNGTTWRSS